MKDVQRLNTFDDEEIFSQIKINNIWIPYIVSTYGRIFSMYFYHSKNINLKEIKLCNDKDGYLIFGIRLTGDHKITLKVHRMVAINFVPNYNKNQNTVNHIDGHKDNNYYKNLEWVTAEENISHAIKTGLRPIVSNNKYTEDEIKYVCSLLENNKSLKEICKMTNIPYSTITNILYKKNWTHISKYYNFDSYRYGKPKLYKKRIHKACKMIASSKYTYKEIAEKTGLSIYIIKSIKCGECHKKIMDEYR